MTIDTLLLSLTSLLGVAATAWFLVLVPSGLAYYVIPIPELKDGCDMNAGLLLMGIFSLAVTIQTITALIHYIKTGKLL